MNPRERLLLIAAIVMLGVVAFRFVIYAPKQAEYASLIKARNEKARELARDQEILATRDRVLKEYERLAAFIREVEAKLPSNKEVPALLTAMERFTRKLGIEMQSFRPTPLEAVVKAPGAPQGSSAPAAPTPGTEGGARTVPYFRMQVNLSLSATLAQAVAYLRDLHDLPRLVIVDSITLSPTKLPKLGVSLATQIYVLGTPSPGRP